MPEPPVAAAAAGVSRVRAPVLRPEPPPPAPVSPRPVRSAAGPRRGSPQGGDHPPTLLPRGRLGVGRVRVRFSLARAGRRTGGLARIHDHRGPEEVQGRRVRSWGRNAVHEAG